MFEPADEDVYCARNGCGDAFKQYYRRVRDLLRRTKKEHRRHRQSMARVRRRSKKATEVNTAKSQLETSRHDVLSADFMEF